MQQTRNKRVLLNLIKSIYKKPTANIILNDETLNAFWSNENVLNHDRSGISMTIELSKLILLNN